MVNIVYLIASHKSTEQIIRLVKALKSGNPNNWVVIHHDQSTSHLHPSAFSGMKNVHTLKDCIKVEWGDFSMIRMILSSIDYIDSHIEYDWLVFISGQDYPIQPIHKIEEYLENTRYDAFINAFPLDEFSSKKELYDRYYYQYLKFPTFLRYVLEKVQFVNRFQPLFRIKPGIPQNKPRIGIRSMGPPFTDAFRCYKGTYWFTLSYKSIRYIQKFVRENPNIVNYYRRTLNPDESFFITILKNNPEFNILNNDKRYITWNDPQYGFAHPDILRVRDFDRIIASNKHFARKFDINVDPQILNMLDENIK